jgi:hypothetical protein
MDLETFVKESLMQVVRAVDSASDESVRSIRLTDSKGGDRTVEFDIAVAVENDKKVSGKAGIKVLQFAGADTSLEKGNKNSTVTRIKFGVHIEWSTKQEQERDAAYVRKLNARPADIGENFFER